MKKFVSVLLAGLMAAGLAACGSTAVASSSAAADNASSAASSSKAAAVSSPEDAAAATAGGAIASLDDLKGKKIGVQLGTTGDIYATDDFGEENVEEYNKGADAVQALKTGKVDAVIIDNEPAKVFVAQNSELALLDTPYTQEDYAMCLAKGSDLTAKFDTAIAELKADGTLDAILDKYINKTEGAKGYVTPDGTAYPNGTLTMATNAYFPPYEYYDGENIVGIDAEFAKAICDKLGYELKIEDMEFDAIIPAVNSGKANFGAAGMTVTDERKQSVDFTDSYATGIQSVIVKK